MELTKEQKDKFFKDHLPYNIGILLAHYINTKKSWQGDKYILQSMFVGSIIKGRLFLETMGVTYSKSNGLVIHNRNDDTVYARHLDGKEIDIDKLDENTCNLLYDFLFLTNKAEAHLTSLEDIERVNRQHIIHPAILKILELVKEHIYDNREFPEEIKSLLEKI
jgi:hypothetical protein